MKRKNLLTAGIGIAGMLFALTASLSHSGPRFFFIVLGLGLFVWAAYALYKGRGEVEEDTTPIERHITGIELLSDTGEKIAFWDLYQRVSAVIGKDLRENHVDIDLSKSEYCSTVDLHHAVLNFAGGNWYVEDLGSRNGVTVQKVVDGRKYKLDRNQPCRLEYGDILLIGLCKLKLR